MTNTFTAVYRGGAFHPTSPPELADGATVTLTMEADPAEGTPGQQAYDIIRAIVARHAGKPDPIGDGLVVSENVDKVLYSDPHGEG